MTLRSQCFRFYWRVQGLIAPGLKDAQLVYEDHLRQLVPQSRNWLDIGCGHQVLPAWRSEAERTLIKTAGLVIGLDPEHDALKRHRSIQKRVRGELAALPFRDTTFDLVTANMVLEHLQDPVHHLTEIFRVLKAGGRLLALTPNAFGYQVILARCIPDLLKRPLIKLLQNRAAEDVFRTYYRINTAKAIEGIAAEAGFSKAVVEHVSTDAQLIMVPPLVVPELFLIRLLMTNPLRRFRPNLVAIARKSPPQSERGGSL